MRTSNDETCLKLATKKKSSQLTNCEKLINQGLYALDFFIAIKYENSKKIIAINMEPIR